MTCEVVKAGLHTFVSSAVCRGECCIRLYVNAGVDVKCTVTVKRFDFIIILLLLLKFFNRINPDIALKQ